ncbi:MAG TPA: undecaprenyl-phosphate galactose phosphotransferase WbaP [Kiritimatiellia bacterium]|jgi:Undecaprenyl-phosphate galactose phosphotransferase WbaP
MEQTVRTATNRKADTPAPHAGGGWALMADARPPFAFHRRLALNAFVLGVGEVSALMGSLLIGDLIRFLWKGDTMFASWMWVLVAAWLVGATVAKLLPGWGLGPVEELRRTVLLLASVFAATTAMLFWGKVGSETSRFTLTTGFLLSLVMVPLLRLQMKRSLLARKAWGIPVVVYADRETGPRVIEALQEERGLGYHPIGAFSDELTEPGATMAGLPVLGAVNACTSQAPVAVLAMPSLSRDRSVDLLEGPLSMYRKVVLIPDLLEAPSLWVKPRDFVGILGLEISSNLLDPIARVAKRTFDIIFAVVTAPFWIPAGAILAILVWLEDRHSPFFLQQRVGKNAKLFTLWKFRTMRPDAENVLREKLEAEPVLRDEWNANFKLRNDPRVTRVGAFLRRTSLDELPQLINVLRGEVSLVGPRPLPNYHYDELPERVRKLRERVRPGVTGLWQVSGRSEAGHLGMVRWDAYYVRNWSVWLDIVILVRTIRTVATGRGAF